MNKQKLVRIVPRLRFPEFEEDGEWKFREIREVGDIVTGKTPNTKDDSLWNGNILFITPTDIDEQEKYQISTQRKVVETKETKLLPSGSIVYTCIASIGKIAITKDKSISNQQINSIITNSKNNNEFIYYCLLYSTPWIKSIPAASTLPIINKKEFSKIKIKIIPNIKEQQKIAACLTALDDLISAATGRLDALKRHKQGLIQQLLPTEGETMPRLRFAEFRDAGEWVEKTLEDIVDSENSSLALNKIDLKKKGYSVYGADGVVGYIDEYQQDERYISIVKDGAGIGRLNLCQPKSSILGTLTCIKSKNLRNFNLDWIYYQMNIIDFTLYKKGSGIPHIYFSDYKAKFISAPKLREQQKIAACLTTLDDLISAQTQKIAKLNTHKRGLMQQLFPAVDETNR